VFIDIEHHCNTDNQRNGKEISTQELHNDVPVYPADKLIRLHLLEQLH
jgi:hypothetical protein